MLSFFLSHFHLTFLIFLHPFYLFSIFPNFHPFFHFSSFLIFYLFSFPPFSRLVDKNFPVESLWGHSARSPPPPAITPMDLSHCISHGKPHVTYYMYSWTPLVFIGLKISVLNHIFILLYSMFFCKFHFFKPYTFLSGVLQGWILHTWRSMTLVLCACHRTSDYSKRE